MSVNNNEFEKILELDKKYDIQISTSPDFIVSDVDLLPVIFRQISQYISIVDTAFLFLHLMQIPDGLEIRVIF